MTSWVVGYDIRDSRRLIKVHRAMVKVACPLEYSVFLFQGTKAALEAVIVRVKKLIKLSADDVRAYELSESGLQFRIGKAALPKGIVWTGMPSQWCTLEVGGSPEGEEDEFEED